VSSLLAFKPGGRTVVVALQTHPQAPQFAGSQEMSVQVLLSPQHAKASLAVTAPDRPVKLELLSQQLPLQQAAPPTKGP
jgi:hypothetical protein